MQKRSTKEAYLFTQVEVNHTNGLLGMVILVVLQYVWVARQTATAKNKPPLLPCLQGEHRKEAKGYMCVLTMTAPFPDDHRLAKCFTFSVWSMYPSIACVFVCILHQLHCPH